MIFSLYVGFRSNGRASMPQKRHQATLVLLLFASKTLCDSGIAMICGVLFFCDFKKPNLKEKFELFVDVEFFLKEMDPWSTD